MKLFTCSSRLLAVSMLIVFFSACSSGSKGSPPIDASLPLRAQLQIVVDNAVQSGLPGVSLHLQDGDEHISIVAGVVNQDTAQPMTATSISHAGSIGKAFTATLVLRLIDMGYLRLDDPIDLWLDPAMSAMIADSNKITVEMLLAHTNGIQNYFEIPEFQVAFLEAPGKIWAPMELLGYLENTENHFAPGTEYRYTDTSFLLAGFIAERVTGLSIGTALRQWVFEPAGLASTFGPYENLGQPETMRAYLPVSFFEGLDLDVDLDLPADGSDVDSTAWLNSEGDGHASVQSIPADLNTFIRVLIDTETLISEELKTRMTTESFPGVSAYGLGLQIFFDGSMIGHDGKGLGLHSSMRYSPSDDLSLATVVNASFGNYDQLYAEYINQLNTVLERRQ